MEYLHIATKEVVMEVCIIESFDQGFYLSWGLPPTQCLRSPKLKKKLVQGHICFQTLSFKNIF